MQGTKKYDYRKGQGSVPEISKHDKSGQNTRSLRKDYNHPMENVDIK
jgi:hypothetical protein